MLHGANLAKVHPAITKVSVGTQATGPGGKNAQVQTEPIHAPPLHRVERDVQYAVECLQSAQRSEAHSTTFQEHAMGALTAALRLLRARENGEAI